MKPMISAIMIHSALVLTACTQAPIEVDKTVANGTEKAKASNPLLVRSPLQYQAPDFRQIKDAHFLQAFEQGMANQNAEVLAISSNLQKPTLENTLVALEKSGELLTRVSRIFYNLAGSSSNPERRKLQQQLATELATHSDNINLNSQLFSRIQQLYGDRQSLSLDPESLRLLETYYSDFVRAGAKLNEKKKQQLRQINQQLSSLTTEFSQNLLAETDHIAVLFDNKESLDGLSVAQLASAKQAADNANHPGKYLISITNTTRQPILSSLKQRETREKIWLASANRAQSGEYDNSKIVPKLAQLRARKAGLLGFDSWASYSLDEQMAKSPQAAYNMMESMVPAVVNNVKQEAVDIQAMIKADGQSFAIKPWDWAYYANKVRQSRYQLDENEVKQYFEFKHVLNDGVFYTMNQLYGVRFEPRPDLPVYHPDVLAYELFDRDGSSLAIFYADYFARQGKRGGAWMSSFVSQSRLLNQKSVVVNVMNIKKASGSEATLLSYDEVTTMFHELGHGLHGMLSDVHYPSLAGTAVSRDYVEFPSTFEEDWAAYPQVMSHYARHYQTGETIPAQLLNKVLQSRSFNMGFDTLEYLAAALLDMEWHSLSPDAPLQEINVFEAQAIKQHGIDLDYIQPRYKSAYFAHSMGGGYSAGYYAYLWSEILAADAFAYIQELGGLTLENGLKYRKQILETGNSRPPMESYKAFRGQEPTTDALLIRRGLKPSLH